MNSVMKELREQGEKLRNNMVEKITEYIEKHGYSPTVREIGEMTGLKSTSSVQHHLKVLFKEGRLETDAVVKVKILICFKTEKKAKIIIMGNCLDGLTMVTAICKAVAEKLSKDKSISLEVAKKKTLEMISQTIDSAE